MSSKTGKCPKSEGVRTSPDAKRIAWHKEKIKQHLSLPFARENRVLDFLYDPDNIVSNIEFDRETKKAGKLVPTVKQAILNIRPEMLKIGRKTSALKDSGPLTATADCGAPQMKTLADPNSTDGISKSARQLSAVVRANQHMPDVAGINRFKYFHIPNSGNHSSQSSSGYNSLQNSSGLNVDKAPNRLTNRPMSRENRLETRRRVISRGSSKKSGVATAREPANNLNAAGLREKLQKPGSGAAWNRKRSESLPTISPQASKPIGESSTKRDSTHEKHGIEDTKQDQLMSAANMAPLPNPGSLNCSTNSGMTGTLGQMQTDSNDSRLNEFKMRRKHRSVERMQQNRVALRQEWSISEHYLRQHENAKVDMDEKLRKLRLKHHRALQALQKQQENERIPAIDLISEPKISPSQLPFGVAYEGFSSHNQTTGSTQAAPLASWSPNQSPMRPSRLFQKSPERKPMEHLEMKSVGTETDERETSTVEIQTDLWSADEEKALEPAQLVVEVSTAMHDDAQAIQGFVSAAMEFSVDNLSQIRATEAVAQELATNSATLKDVQEYLNQNLFPETVNLDFKAIHILHGDGDVHTKTISTSDM